MIDKIKKYFMPKNKDETSEFTYLQMVEYLKSHYRYEMFIIGQINERSMSKRLSDMSFNDIKTLFDRVLKIEKESSSLNNIERNKK